MNGRITISLIMLVLSCLTRTSAQVVTIAGDSIRIDSVKHYRFVPTGIRVGADLISIVKDQRQTNFNGWEVNGDVDFHRYLLSAEYGKWGRDLPGDSASYRNDGNYWRVGADINFLTKDAQRNVFFLGFRYARSRYSESMSIIPSDSLWGSSASSYENTDLNARWFELTTGIKVKIWKIFWLGYTARMKFGLKKNEDREMISHDIPGYGVVDKDTYWGFNYQVMVRIPLRPNPGAIIPYKKKKKK